MFGTKKRPNLFDRWMMAVTFAEAGDRETALSLIGQAPRQRGRKQARPKVRPQAEQRPVLRA